jgi:hypothetical protein
MIKALDDEPLLHAMMGPCRGLILQAFPCLGDGLIRELLKPRDLVPGGIAFAQWKKLSEKLSYPILRKRERSLHMCAQDVQITCMATIDKQMQCYK